MKHLILKQCPLFRGIEEREIEGLMHCLGAEQRSYRKGDSICNAGDVIRALGIVLSGSVEISSVDFWGNRSVLDKVQPGFVFAETYACLPNEPMLVTVAAAEACEILFVEVNRIFTTCADTCAHHQRMIANMLMISSQKNLNLSRRIFHTSPKTIRGRLLSYLSDQAAKAGSSDFLIPFDRQQLADYLSVDRSALSKELGKMQKDGLLTAKKNHFILSEAFE